MFSDILKFIPQIDKKELDKMEKNLSGRFMRVAKKFGGGLKNVFKGGGWVGAAVGLLNKIMNPLKDIQDAMEKTLGYSSQVVANAEQFGSTPGQLAKLQALAQAKGLDQDSLFNMMSKFQVAIANAEANPNEPSAVRNYVGTTDIAEGFFRFIQNLQGLDKNQRLLVEQSVFGEKQILKMADFINADFPKLMNELTKYGLKSSEYYDKNLKQLNQAAGLADSLKAVRDLNEVADRGGLINKTMVARQDESEKLRIRQINDQLKSYENIQSLSDTMQKIEALIQKAMNLVGAFTSIAIPKIEMFIQKVDAFFNSGWIAKAKSFFMREGGK